MEANEVYFDPEGRATVRLFQDWNRKAAAISLQTRATYVTAGLATREFRAIWRQGFPTRQALPFQPIATRDGRFTDIMLNLWND